MEIVRCSKGHFYDSEENATCPMCAAEAARNKNPLGNNILEDGIIPTEYFGQTGNSHAVDNIPAETKPVNQENGSKVQGYQPTVSAGFQDPPIETPPTVQPYKTTLPVIPVDGDGNEESAPFDPGGRLAGVHRGRHEGH